MLSKAITAQPARAWQSNQQFFCHMETALSVCAQKFGTLIVFIAVVFAVHTAMTLSLATSHFVTSRLTPLLPTPHLTPPNPTLLLNRLIEFNPPC